MSPAISEKASALHTLRARVGPDDFVVDLDERVSLRADSDGRWIFFRDGDTAFRRTVDGGAVISRGARRPPRDVADAASIHARVRDAAAALCRALKAGRLAVHWAGGGAADATLVAQLASVAEWDARRFAALRRRFAAAYREPVQIIPPDRYGNVVVQPTLGCPYARCGFCAFYKDATYRKLTAAEFRSHLQAVKDLFGGALRLRNGVFVGSGNALALPQRRLIAVLGEIRVTLGAALCDCGAFWDPDHSPPRDVAAWNALADAGLARVYAGLETGLPRLRGALGKSASLDAFVARVREQKRSRVHTALTVIAGAGGASGEAAHREATRDVVSGLGLDAHDIVYVSPLRGNPGAPPAEGEERALARLLREATPAKVAPYRVDCFRYYA